MIPSLLSVQLLMCFSCCCCFLSCYPFLQCLSPLRFTMSTSYYGLSLNTSQMHPNPFISSFLSAAVEIPAYILIFVVLRFFRRKVCLLTILPLAAASLLFSPLMPKGRACKTIFGTRCFKTIRIATMARCFHCSAKLYLYFTTDSNLDLRDSSKKFNVCLFCRSSGPNYDHGDDWQRHGHSWHLHDLCPTG